MNTLLLSGGKRFQQVLGKNSAYLLFDFPSVVHYSIREMRLAFSFIISLFLFGFAAPQAHAIVFLPALILIPIAKIIAIVIAGFSLPALGIGVLWNKLFGSSLRKTLIITLGILLLFSIALGIYLKIQFPERPLF